MKNSRGLTVSSWARPVKRVLRNPHFWVNLVLLTLVTVLYYRDQLGLLVQADTSLGLSRHAVERLFYTIPMIYIGYVWGFTPGISATALALVLMVPRDIWYSVSPPDAWFETMAAVLVGVLGNFWLRARASQARMAFSQEHAIATVNSAQEKLRAQIRNSIRRERQLTVLSRLSSSLAESLEMDPLLQSAVDMVVEVMGVDVVLIFSLEEGSKELAIMAYKGVPGEFAQSVDRMKLGEGFNGRVAETGEPLLIEDASSDPRLAREAVRRENLKAQLIVPIKARGKVLGTLCVAVRQKHIFNSEEIELLTAIANQIGVGIENARLRQRQLEVAEQLRHSERHYRELFENARDAIWVHDFNGNVLSANPACGTLTGYTVKELCRMNVKEFILDRGQASDRAADGKPPLAESENEPHEQHLLRQNGAQAILMVTTNLISQDGHSQAFQNIARDITQEKQMQDNLRSYVQLITVAQEKERLRIARELHDSTAQNLIALLHRLENFLRDQVELPIDKVKELWAFHEQTKEILQEVRSVSRDLRPSILDDVGLLSALHLIVREMQAEHGIPAKLEVNGQERRLPPEVELVLFRVIQEA